MNQKTRTRNAKGSGELLRAEILDAAIALIDETDDATALTLRGIARRAGISAPSIYTHFDNIAAVTEAVLHLSFRQLEHTISTAIDSETDPVAKLLAGGRAYVQFGWNHKARYRLMFAETGYAENAVDIFQIVALSIEACVEVGASTSTDPRADTWTIWAALHGVATLDKPARREQLKLGALDRSAMLETIIRRLAQLN